MFKFLRRFLTAKLPENMEADGVKGFAKTATGGNCAEFYSLPGERKRNRYKEPR